MFNMKIHDDEGDIFFSNIMINLLSTISTINAVTPTNKQVNKRKSREKLFTLANVFTEMTDSDGHLLNF